MQLVASLHLGHAHFAGTLVLLGFHLHVALGEAETAMVLEEGSVATFENVYLRVCKTGVVLFVNGTVAATDMLGHEWGTVGGVLAVEDESFCARGGEAKEMFGKQILVVVVDGPFDVSAVELVVEATVNDGSSIQLVREAAVEQVDQSLLGDAW